MAKRSKTKVKTMMEGDEASALPEPVSPAEAPELRDRQRSKTKTMGDGVSALSGPVPPAELRALRARLIAALAGGFVPVWRWLQQSGIGRFVSYVFSELRVRLDPSAGSHCNPVQIVDPSPASDPSAASQKKKKPEVPATGPVKVRAVWFSRLKKPKQPPPSAAADSTPTPTQTPKPELKLHVVDNIEVPLDQENRFQEYCKRAMNVQGRSSLCHYCVFEWECVPNGIVPNSGMSMHCGKFHDGVGIMCEAEDCQVRFKENTQRERRLHQYFYHELPQGWWLKPRRTLLMQAKGCGWSVKESSPEGLN